MRVGLSALLCLAACQPQARRLLLLDLALTDPVALEATAQPWHEAGYRVAYRRFYPHLTRQDLDRYRTLLLLGGRAPESPSDALTAGDLALLSEWVGRGRGGVVVFGYAGDGEGFFDRWLMNRWLASLGTGIVIGDFVLHDTVQRPAATEPQPRAAPERESPLGGATFDPFPFGRNHVLLATHDRQTLARTTASAFVRPQGQPPAGRPRAAVVAASRVGGGLVVVASRHALAALGADYRPSTTPLAALDELVRTRAFLQALARWTRRPAEWALVPLARKGVRLVLGDGPLAVAPRPPRLGPPEGTEPVELPAPRESRAAERSTAVPGWMARQGMRVLWGALSTRTRLLDSLVSFLEVGAFNVLATGARPEVIADSLRSAPWERDLVRAAWRETLQRLETTNLRWVPAIGYEDLHLPFDTLARGIRGDTLATWCALDARLWNEALAPAYRTLARLAAERADVIPAIALDLGASSPEAVASPGMGWDFCDATYRAGLAALGKDSAWTARFAALPVAARYDSLLEAGLLGAYFGALEDLVAERAGAIRAEVRRIRPDLLFAFRLAQPAADWFSLGILRGFSGPPADAPLLVWSHEVRARDLLAAYRRRGIHAIHAIGLSPRQIPPSAWPRLRRAVFGESDGFWIPAAAERIPDAPRSPGGPLSADSLGRLIRRLSQER